MTTVQERDNWAGRSTDEPASPSVGTLRILYVINDMGRGGAEIQVAELAKRLAYRGHDVSLCVLMTYLDFRAELEAAGVRTFALAMRHGRPTLGGLLRLARVMREARPHVVHAHLFGATILSRLARLLAPVPRLITTAHRPDDAPWRYTALRATDRLCDLWTNVSAEGHRAHIAAGAVTADRAAVVPNGIDVDAFIYEATPQRRRALRERLGVPSDAFLWLTAGSFRDEQKDYSTLLHAFAAVREFEPTAHLRIAGEGVLRASKERLCRELGLESNVAFLGLRDDLPELLAASDAFVLASRWEALPMVLLEAGAAELPAVATRVGSNADIIEHGRTGLLVPERDPTALATAMQALMRMPLAERREMGRNAHEHVRGEFELDRVVVEWERLYAARATTHSSGSAWR